MDNPNIVAICCSACSNATATVPNDWVRVNESYITTVTKPQYTTTKVEHSRAVWAQDIRAPGLTAVTSSEASCQNCKARLGDYMRATWGRNKGFFKEGVLYEELSIHLRDPKTQAIKSALYLEETLARLVKGAKGAQSGGSKKRKLTLPVDLDTPEDDHSISGQAEPEQNDIKRLRKSVQMLQGRVAFLERREEDLQKLLRDAQLLPSRLSLVERSIVEISNSLTKYGPTEGPGKGRGKLTKTCAAVLGALGGDSSSGQSLEELRLDNEALRQKIGLGGAPEAPRHPLKTGAGPEDESLLETAQSQDNDEGSPKVASNAPEDEWRSFIADMTDYADPSEDTRGNSLVRQPSPTVRPDFSSPSMLPTLNLQGLASAQTSPSRSTRPGKRPRAGGDTASTEAAQGHTLKKREQSKRVASRNKVSLQQSRLLSPQLRESDATPFAQVSAVGPDSALDQGEATVDPALASSTIPPAQAKVPSAAARIEKSAGHQLEDPRAEPMAKNGIPAYDSLHESRIREHRARDAERKRQNWKKVKEQNRKTKDQSFKESEKIKARDKAVRLLMETE